MVTENSNTPNDIIESINEAFDNGNSYGLEYVLDELVSKKPTNQDAVDWFGDTDYFA
jgi:hypothetical protein